ncbi:MAG: DedA family protein [Planctomycetota bacterium]
MSPLFNAGGRWAPGAPGERWLDFFGPLSAFLLDYGYLAVFFVLLLCGLGLPIPEELTLIGAGLVVYEGRADLFLMIAVTVVGILAGDSLLLFLGRRYGPQLLKKPLFRRLLHADRMSRVQRQFDRHGAKAVFFARFFAGIRACVYFTAGTLGMRYRTFILLDLGGALLSAPVSVWLGMHFGGHIERAFAFVAKLDHALMFCLTGLALFFLVRWLIARVRRSR